MMSEKTRKIFLDLKKEFGNSPFTYDDIAGISNRTFYKYRKEMGIVSEIKIIRSLCPLNFIVDILNDIEYYSESMGEYILENDKIYEVKRKIYFHFT